MSAPRLVLRAVLRAALLGSALGACAEAPPRERPRSAVLFTLDTTRADACSPYGAPAGVTPALAALAEQGVLYERAYTVAPLTLPAHASMLTGLYPPRHGVRDNGVRALPEAARTLAEAAREAGLETAAFVGAVVLDEGFGLDQGFEVYDVPPRPLDQERGYYPERPAHAVAEKVLAWLDARDAERGFLLWVHLWDPHSPYEPPAPFAELFPRNPYYGELASADAALTRILVRLEERGLLDETLVLAVADHGEAFGEHGEISHAAYCYETTVRVPLVIRYPDGHDAGRREAERIASVVDVFPTLAEGLGLAVPAGLDGRSLWRRRVPEGRGAYLESYYGHFAFGWSPLSGWVDEDGKYLHSSEPQLFDPLRDPGEEHDLAAARAGELGRYREAIAAVAALPALEADASVPAELAESLRGLGYAALAPAEREAPHPLAAGGPSPQSRVAEQQALQAALGALETGDPAEAERLLGRLVAENPANLFALERLALALIRQGRHAEAVGPLERVLEEGPPRPDAWCYLATCQMVAGRPDEAIEAFSAALSVDAGHTQALAGLAHLLEQAGRGAEAAPLRERLRRIEERR